MSKESDEAWDALEKVKPPDPKDFDLAKDAEMTLDSLRFRLSMARAVLVADRDMLAEQPGVTQLVRDSNVADTEAKIAFLDAWQLPRDKARVEWFLACCDRATAFNKRSGGTGLRVVDPRSDSPPEAERSYPPDGNVPYLGGTVESPIPPPDNSTSS